MSKILLKLIENLDIAINKTYYNKGYYLHRGALKEQFLSLPYLLKSSKEQLERLEQKNQQFKQENEQLKAELAKKNEALEKISYIENKHKQYFVEEGELKYKTVNGGVIVLSIAKQALEDKS